MKNVLHLQKFTILTFLQPQKYLDMCFDNFITGLEKSNL